MTVIFQNRGKQYKVKVGDFLKLPRISDLKKNDQINFDEVIFMKNDKGESFVGSPKVEGVTVIAKVIDQIKDKKIIVFKKKRSHNYRRKIGHRQDLTLVKIEELKITKSKVETKTKVLKNKPSDTSTKGESSGA